MEVLAQPEIRIPTTYIPLGLSQVTRTNFIGGIHLPISYAKPLKYSRKEKLALSTQKLRDFFRRSPRINLEANSDFIFYTVSSKSHLQSKRESLVSDVYRNRCQTINNSSSRWRSSRVNWLTSSVFLVWILIFMLVVVWSVVRYQQLDGWSYLLTTIEGKVVLALFGMVVASGIIILVGILMVVRRPKKEEAFCVEQLNRLSNRISIETLV